MALGDDFDYLGDVEKTDYDGTYKQPVYRCPTCYAVVDEHTDRHEQWHRSQQQALTVEVRWESDDYAVFYVNGQRAGYYDHDLHGRDGLEGMLRLAEETARILGGTFRSDG